MNHKTNVLNHIPRDTELSLGCEIELSRGTRAIYVSDSKNETIKFLLFKATRGSRGRYCPKKEIKIIGHPTTPLDLLRALNKTNQTAINCHANISQKNLNLFWTEGDEKRELTIPLVRHLSEIDAEDKLWQKLAVIFKLV